MPGGFGYEWTELAHQGKLVGNTGLLVFGASVVFVFLVLAAQYESWALPLSVILIVSICGIDFVALRYGFFYGTWLDADGDIGEQVHRRQVSVIGDGQGVWNWVHIEDAAAATTIALDCAPGAYNRVDDNPSPQHRWLPAFASWVGAPPPPRISEAEATATLGSDTAYYATRLRGAAKGKAKRELNFRPRPLEWLAAARWITR